MVHQTDQERAEGVRRLLGCRARPSQQRLKMRVGAACDGLTIREESVQRRQRTTLLLKGNRIKEDLELRVETGLSRQHIPHENLIDGRLMASMPADATALQCRAPVHIGCGQIRIQAVRRVPREIMLVTK